MRSIFPGHYRPTEAIFAEKMKTSLFRLDTNILLNLYRYTDGSRAEFINIFKNGDVHSRIWLAHRVAFEFQRRRIDLFEEQHRKSVKLSDILERAAKEVGSEKRTARFSTYEHAEACIKQLQTMIADLAKHQNELPDLMTGDEIFDTISDLFEGKVGQPFSPDAQASICKEGEKRYADKIPPGYGDKAKPGDIDKYGDLIIWKQILRHAKDNKKDVIFVTDDSKEDWWRKEKGRTLGPRPELVEEFMKETDGQWFYMYTAESFLAYAKRSLSVDVSDDAITEAVTVREKLAETATSGPGDSLTEEDVISMYRSPFRGCKHAIILAIASHFNRDRRGSLSHRARNIAAKSPFSKLRRAVSSLIASRVFSQSVLRLMDISGLIPSSQKSRDLYFSEDTPAVRRAVESMFSFLGPPRIADSGE